VISDCCFVCLLFCVVHCLFRLLLTGLFAEALFTPSLVDCEQEGMADLLFKTIQGADIDLRE
jgi:hypothetical protein